MSHRTERSIFAIVGRMNAGKSSMLNVLSGQKDFAIVDSTPGTTTDTVTTVMEIHGIGPCKVLDTAGIDEESKLGEKKRKKTFEAIEESDCCIVVLDLMKQEMTHDVLIEQELIAHAESVGKQVLIVHNVRGDSGDGEEARLRIDRLIGNTHPSIVIDASNMKEQRALATFISTFFRKESREIDLLPSLKDQGFVLLVIPMDEETPALRLLRPQDMAVERILRRFATPVLFRPDLAKARNTYADIHLAEQKRYESLLEYLMNSSEGLQLAITDSQAFDIIAKWTPKEIPLTSFSIMMTNYMSFGNLPLFLEGAEAATRLRPGDRVLIAEACNHDRQPVSSGAETCDDIGTVQLPRLLEQSAGGKLSIDFSFGRTFPDDLFGYKLIVHCGGCMIDRQKYARRLVLAREANVPITNYGILLAFLHGGKETLKRAAAPFFCINSTQLS